MIYNIYFTKSRRVPDCKIKCDIHILYRKICENNVVYCVVKFGRFEIYEYGF